MFSIARRCHCGRIAFKARVNPQKTRICHCTDCQTLSGSPFRVVVPARQEDFMLLAGEPGVCVKTAQSGRKRQQAFCPDCGTPIFATSAGEEPRVLGIRVGSATQRDQFVPEKQYWSRSAQGWLHELASIPGVDEQWSVS